MKFKDVWIMLITRQSYPDMECWWLCHDEKSNVIVIRNHKKRGILNLGIKIWHKSGRHFSATIAKLRTDGSAEIKLNDVPQWHEMPPEDEVAAVELYAGNKSLCFKNIAGKLIFTYSNSSQIIRACQSIN